MTSPSAEGSPVRALLDRAQARLDAGERHEARELAEAALARAETLDDADRERMLAHNLLGIVGKHTGEFELAAEHYGAAVEILRRTGEDPDALGALHHNLGGLAFSRGDLDAAERETRRALEVHGELYGPDHPNVQAHRGQLGSILSEQGRLDEAREILERAVAGFGEALGDDHLEVGIATTSLGLVHHRAGRTDEAERCYREGLAIRERAVGPDHPELAFTLLNLGQLHAERGDDDAARALAARAARVLEGGVADDHPALVAARERSRARQ